MGVTVLVLLSGCPGEVPPRTGLDAPLGSGPDAPLGTPDGPAGTPDARAGTPDARATADAPTPCVLADGGPAGICISTTSCASMGGVSTPGHCPGPVDIQCCTGLGMADSFSCDPGAMLQPNQGLTEEPGTGGCPAGMLRVADPTHGFCIDRFEAALDRDDGDGTTSPWSPYFNPGGAKVIARSLRGAVPQGYIAGQQAKQACLAAGKRLCLDTEWLRACRGPDALIFPYGDTRETGVCNDHRDEHPAVELFGAVVNLSSPCINQLHDTVDRTGTRAGCVTADGAFDMMGNLHEWTADPNGTFRGGFYVDTVINGAGCLYTTTAHDTAYSDYSTGFRCCAD